MDAGFVSKSRRTPCSIPDPGCAGRRSHAGRGRNTPPRRQPHCARGCCYSGERWGAKFRGLAPKFSPRRLRTARYRRPARRANEAIFKRILDDPDFKDVIGDFYVRKVYERMRSAAS